MLTQIARLGSPWRAFSFRHSVLHFNVPSNFSTLIYGPSFVMRGSEGKITKALLFALIPAFIVVGCDSSGSNTDKGNEDKAEVSLALSNTGQNDFPGSPTKVTIRTWRTNGQNAALRTVEFPSEGETREVSIFTPPGDLFVGIMAHNNDGIVSFAAVTDEAQNFTAGESTSVNLENSLNLWDFEYSIVGGELEVGSFIVFETTEELSVQKSDQLIEGDIDDPRGTVFYDSQSFNSVSEAQFDATIERVIPTEDSIQRRTTNNSFENTFEIENEALLDSMFIRVELPVDPRWGDEPTSIVRPHPDSSALRLEDITSEISITFDEEL